MSLDKENKSFWSFVCGSNLKFWRELSDYDAAYMKLYPYLWKYITPQTQGPTLEIGPGMGTLGQILSAKCRNNYVSVDITYPVPVMMKKRGLSNAVQGNALNLPFKDSSFKTIYSIGCLHHTGNISSAFSEVSRVLRPGGIFVGMVYNGNSFKAWFLKTVKKDNWKYHYDHNPSGQTAPWIDLVTKKQLKHYLKDFETFLIYKENFSGRLRRFLLSNIAKLCGDDLYFLAMKGD